VKEFRSSRVSVAGKFEYDIQLERLTISVPPACFALMAGTEVDFRAVGKRKLDLDNVVGSAIRTLQRFCGDASSPTHRYKSSRQFGALRRISRSCHLRNLIELADITGASLPLLPPVGIPVGPMRTLGACVLTALHHLPA